MVREMLFRPNFCAHCGEKIDRADWGIFTSRRFCQVCESVFKGYELLPRIVVGLALIIGLFGVGVYLKSSPSVAETQLIRQPRKLAEQAMPVAQAATKDVPATAFNSGNTAPPAVSASQNPTVLGRTETRVVKAADPQRVQVETAAEMYFCGAETKKGTPCRHRVKGNIRCFQHAGMPAMLPADKLRIN